MASEITSFQGDFRFLSNFYGAPVRLQGRLYPTAEHAYQAMKCETDAEREVFVLLDSPGAAKRRGQAVSMRADWEQVKKRIMLAVVMAKFTQNEPLREQLTATGEAYLEEGNTWHDNYWGSCRCAGCGERVPGGGLNYLGQILTAVRFIVRPD